MLRAPGSRRTREVQERDMRMDTPCRWRDGALPGVATRYFDLEPRLPGEVDA